MIFCFFVEIDTAKEVTFNEDDSIEEARQRKQKNVLLITQDDLSPTNSTIVQNLNLLLNSVDYNQSKNEQYDGFVNKKFNTYEYKSQLVDEKDGLNKTSIRSKKNMFGQDVYSSPSGSFNLPQKVKFNKYIKMRSATKRASSHEKFNDHRDYNNRFTASKPMQELNYNLRRDRNKATPMLTASSLNKKRFRQALYYPKSLINDQPNYKPNLNQFYPLPFSYHVKEPIISKVSIPYHPSLALNPRLLFHMHAPESRFRRDLNSRRSHRFAVINNSNRLFRKKRLKVAASDYFPFDGDIKELAALLDEYAKQRFKRPSSFRNNISISRAHLPEELITVKPNYDILGSGNFEIIKGGLLVDAESNKRNSIPDYITPYIESKEKAHKSSEDYDDFDEESQKNHFLRGHYYSPSPILGFQGYDNFRDASDKDERDYSKAASSKKVSSHSNFDLMDYS